MGSGSSKRQFKPNKKSDKEHKNKKNLGVRYTRSSSNSLTERDLDVSHEKAKGDKIVMDRSNNNSANTPTKVKGTTEKQKEEMCDKVPNTDGDIRGAKGDGEKTNCQDSSSKISEIVPETDNTSYTDWLKEGNGTFIDDSEENQQKNKEATTTHTSTSDKHLDSKKKTKDLSETKPDTDSTYDYDNTINEGNGKSTDDKEENAHKENNLRTKQTSSIDKQMNPELESKPKDLSATQHQTSEIKRTTDEKETSEVNNEGNADKEINVTTGHPSQGTNHINSDCSETKDENNSENDQNCDEMSDSTGNKDSSNLKGNEITGGKDKFGDTSVDKENAFGPAESQRDTNSSNTAPIKEDESSLSTASNETSGDSATENTKPLESNEDNVNTADEAASETTDENKKDATKQETVNKNKNDQAPSEYVLNENLQFYRNEIPSKPFPGEKIEDMLKWKGDYRKLEFTHSYIQWLFPIPESRGMNYSAQPLQEHEAEIIREDETLRNRVLEAFRMMLDFYGMELDSKKLTTITRAENWEERYEHLNRSIHNHLRVTRIIKALGELGWKDLQVAWLEFIMHEAVTNKVLPKLGRESTMSHFIDAMKDEEMKWKMYSLLADLNTSRKEAELKESEIVAAKTSNKSDGVNKDGHVTENTQTNSTENTTENNLQDGKVKNSNEDDKDSKPTDNTKANSEESKSEEDEQKGKGKEFNEGNNDSIDTENLDGVSMDIKNVKGTLEGQGVDIAADNNGIDDIAKTEADSVKSKTKKDENGELSEINESKNVANKTDATKDHESEIKIEECDKSKIGSITDGLNMNKKTDGKASPGCAVRVEEKGKLIPGETRETQGEYINGNPITGSNENENMAYDENPDIENDKAIKKDVENEGKENTKDKKTDGNDNDDEKLNN